MNTHQLLDVEGLIGGGRKLDKPKTFGIRENKPIRTTTVTLGDMDIYARQLLNDAFHDFRELRVKDKNGKMMNRGDIITKCVERALELDPDFLRRMMKQYLVDRRRKEIWERTFRFKHHRGSWISRREFPSIKAAYKRYARTQILMDDPVLLVNMMYEYPIRFSKSVLRFLKDYESEEILYSRPAGSFSGPTEQLMMYETGAMSDDVRHTYQWPPPPMPKNFEPDFVVLR